MAAVTPGLVDLIDPNAHLHVWMALYAGGHVCCVRGCRLVRTEPIERAWAA